MSASLKSAPCFPTYDVDETTLVFAFRYALGRQSTAPGHVVAELRRHWPRLNRWTQLQIKRDIQRAVECGEVRGYDLEIWLEVLLFKIAAQSESDACLRCEMSPHVCLCSHDDENDEH